MAITTYENHIPPSLEHLVWGGGALADRDRCYFGSSCINLTEKSNSKVPCCALNIMNNYLVLTSYKRPNRIAYIARYTGLESLPGTDVGGLYSRMIVDYRDDSYVDRIDCSSEEREFYLSLIPESWIVGLQSSATSYYEQHILDVCFKLPIR